VGIKQGSLKRRFYCESGPRKEKKNVDGGSARHNRKNETNARRDISLVGGAGRI